MSDMVERAAKAVYAGSPLYESGEAIDGFQVTPGGDMSWEHAIQLAAEFGGEYQAALDEHRALARAALLAALDIEDSATIDAAATGIMDAEGTTWGVSRNYARAAIAALKKHAQGERAP